MFYLWYKTKINYPLKSDLHRAAWGLKNFLPLVILYYFQNRDYHCSQLSVIKKSVIKITEILKFYLCRN